MAVDFRALTACMGKLADGSLSHRQASLGSAERGAVELHDGRFVAVDLSGAVVGNYATLNDAREALLTQRRGGTGPTVYPGAAPEAREAANGYSRANSA
jgi:hypothetical protein